MLNPADYRELMEDLIRLRIDRARKEYDLTDKCGADEEVLERMWSRIDGMREIYELVQNSAFLTDTPEYEDEKREVEEDYFYDHSEFIHLRDEEGDEDDV